MFTCKMCKQTVDGDPARTNGVGQFCLKCHNEISSRGRKSQNITCKCGAPVHSKGMCSACYQKMWQANRRFQEHYGSQRTCIWCGDYITKNNEQTGKTDENVCRDCSSGRNWLLKCMRYSDKAAKYVACRETIAAAYRAKLKIEQDDRPDGRIDRLERLMETLVRKLGGQ